MIKLRLPYPPATQNSLHKFWAHKGKVKVYLNPKIRRYYAEVMDIIEDLDEETLELLPITTPISIEVCMTMPDKRKRDLDNVEKVLYDALQKSGVIDDDSMIYYKTVYKKISLSCEIETVKSGSIDIKITPISI